MTASLSRSILSTAIAGLLLAASVGVSAQTPADRAQERRERAQQTQADAAPAAPASSDYANATRTAPAAKASARMSPRLQKMVKAYDDDKGAEAIAEAEEIIASDRANEYDRAFAAQIAAQTAYDADDMATAMAYLEKALQFNGLDNNGHFGAMLMLAQLQLQEDQYAQSLTTFDRFLTESGSRKPEHLVLKGNALYRLDRFAEAAQVLKQAIDASPAPRADWLQLLMGAYVETGQDAEGLALAERIGAKNPNDKRSQLNLAAIYQQADLLDKSAEVLESLRAAGQLTEDREYRQLYATYLNMDGKERKAVAVINEGLEKGMLQAGSPDLPGAGAGLLFLRPDRRRRSTPTRRPRRWPITARRTSTSPGAVAGRPHPRSQGSRKAGRSPRD